jgi:hypothetical protein
MILVSPTHSPRSGSPTSPRPPSITDAVKNVAEGHLAKRTSESAAPLIGKVTQKSLVEKYNEAEELLPQNRAQANLMYLEILEALPEDLSGPALTFRAACKLGVAISSTGSDAAARWAKYAQEDLDKVYDNINSWENFLPPAKIGVYQELKSGFVKFKLLIPETNVRLHQELQAKIDVCIKNIPLLDDFYVRLNTADQCVQQGGLEQARELYTDALKNIEKENAPEYLLAKGYGYLHFARSYAIGTEERKEKAGLASKNISYFDVAACELYRDDEAKKKITYQTLLPLLAGLMELFPETDTAYPVILKRFNRCQAVLAELQAEKSPKAGEDTATLRESPKIVSKEPAGEPWKAARLFVAFTFAFLVIGTTVALGKRYFSKMD